MARRDSNSPTGFKKVLQFIGIVDEVVPEQPYDNGYQSGQYGQPSPYVPPRRQNTHTTRPASERKRIPAQDTRSNARTYGREEDAHRPQRSVSYDSSEYSAPASRPRSRFEAAAEEAPQPRVRPHAAPRGDSGNVVLTLYTLRDARKVIRALVAGQTVIMNIATNETDTRTRITDTLSGAIFAVGGTFRKAGEMTYVLAPRGVNVRSDAEMDEED